MQAGHKWLHHDLTDTFPVWMAGQEYRNSYFESPEDMEMALDDYASAVIAAVRAGVEQPVADATTVYAITGLASLFGLMRAARLIEAVAPQVRGRLLVFFPGERDGVRYRLLDATDGWNYLAIPITSEES